MAVITGARMQQIALRGLFHRGRVGLPPPVATSLPRSAILPKPRQRFKPSLSAVDGGANSIDAGYPTTTPHQANFLLYKTG
ncbi:MAG TPA: hypothetical protein VGF34_13680 [Stellaceae bacterium]